MQKRDTRDPKEVQQESLNRLTQLEEQLAPFFKIDNKLPRDKKIALIRLFADMICGLEFPLTPPSHLSVAEQAALKALTNQYVELSKTLANFYEQGDAVFGVSRDSVKARKYQGESNKKLTTEQVYGWAGWFTSIRLFIVRLNSVLDKVGHAFINGVLVKVAKAASLSYAIEFLADTIVVLRTVFFAGPVEKSKNLSWWSRFKNTMFKGERPARLANAVVWFGINLACLFVTGGVSSILNVTGFFFDILVDLYKFFRDRARYRTTLASITDKKQELIDTYSANHAAVLKLNVVEEKIKVQRDREIYKRYRGLTVSTCLFIAVFVVTIALYPPFGLSLAAGVALGMKLGGALGSLFIGSTIAGLGKRIYDNVLVKWIHRLGEKFKQWRGPAAAAVLSPVSFSSSTTTASQSFRRHCSAESQTSLASNGAASDNESEGSSSSCDNPLFSPAPSSPVSKLSTFRRRSTLSELHSTLSDSHRFPESSKGFFIERSP